MTTWGYTSATASDTSGYVNFQWHVRSAPPPIDPKLLAAVALFGLTIPLESWDVVQQRYRQLAREHHPDAGGDPERMKAINAAYDLLKAARPQ